MESNKTNNILINKLRRNIYLKEKDKSENENNDCCICFVFCCCFNNKLPAQVSNYIPINETQKRKKINKSKICKYPSYLTLFDCFFFYFSFLFSWYFSCFSCNLYIDRWRAIYAIPWYDLIVSCVRANGKCD